MQEIKDCIDRFLKNKKIDRHYALTTPEMIAFIEEMSFADANRLFYAISTLFRYGYVKGYRAAKAEIKKTQNVECHKITCQNCSEDSKYIDWIFAIILKNKKRAREIYYLLYGFCGSGDERRYNT